MHNAADIRTVKRYQVFLFALLSLVYMMPFVQGVIMSVVAKDVMAELRLSPEQMGLLGSAYMWCYAGSMIFSGMAAAYFGPRRYLTGMYLISGIGGVVFAGANALPLACLGRALAGIGTAGVLTSSLTLFARWYRGESYATTCALFFSVGGLGAFLGAGPLAVANAAWGWRACLLFIGLLTVVYAILVLFFVRDWPPAGMEQMLGVSAAPRERITLATMWKTVKTLSGSRDFWKLALWFMGMSGFYLSFAGLWAVPYLKDVHGLTDAKAGMALSMFSFGFIIGNPLVSWLSDKLRSNRIGLAGSGGLCLALILIMMAAGTRLHYLGIILLCFGFGMGCNAPNVLIYASARNLFGSRMANIASGVLAGLCFVAGAFLQVVGGGVLGYAERRGMDHTLAYILAFLPYILCFLTAIYCGATLSRNSDPGRISPLSLRAQTRIVEKPDEKTDEKSS
ncbi:MAG: MFS transporter [Planctomycetaceae bacterium]|nr:MFS transporter [Planctomycetaceae bacterium]